MLIHRLAHVLDAIRHVLLIALLIALLVVLVFVLVFTLVFVLLLLVLLKEYAIDCCDALRRYVELLGMIRLVWHGPNSVLYENAVDPIVHCYVHQLGDVG